MKSLATHLMLTAFLCCQCRSQSPEQHLAYAVDAAIAKMEVLSQRFEEMGNQLNTKVEEMGTQMNTKFEEMGNQLNTKVEEMGTQMNTKFEELHDRMTTMEELEGKMDIIQGQLVELQGSSNVESVLQLCAETVEMERDFQREVINQTCNNNMNQIANLQESFSTELDRIERSINGCSSKVSNLQGLLAIDVDECSGTGENSCHRYAVCNNHPVGYTCTCDRGFSGDGFNCEGCGTDFTDVPGVGCLKAFEEMKTFDDASTHCSTLDAQLVAPQNFQALQDYVDSLPSKSYYLIGVRDRKWTDGRDVGPEEWRTSQPNNNVTDCGYIYPKQNGIVDWGCNVSKRFICQLKYNAP